MIPRFFIDRPIFATVLSLIVMIAGGIAAFALPIAQYPEVTPPTIQIDCNYPGADAKTVSDCIASPIEQQVNGVEDMIYMSSQCTNDGSYTLTVTFKTGSDLNMCQVRVLNRVALAMPQLPPEVRQTGLTTRKRSPEILLTISLNSPNGTYDQLYLSNYASIRVKEELARLPGISEVTIFGQRDYSMRIWVNPEQLAARNLTAGDVVAALREQNTQLVAGQVGQPPTGKDQAFQFTIAAVGRLQSIEDFENVVLKVGKEGQRVRIKDVARVELGAKNSEINSRFDLKPTTGLGVFLLSNANSVDTEKIIRKKMEEIARDFPPDVAWDIGYNTAPFIVDSIKEVLYSLVEAVALVALVVLVFLGSWRAAIIPLAAVPVAIIGTFAAMFVADFSINNLTLFGLVLAVGIVVDDAIVVVEAVQHKLELGYAPREATIRAMDDVAGPVLAVGVVLSAVFIPCAFLSGIIGAFFRQFALTIAISTMISTFNSLTLSPALAALLLKPHTKKKPSILGRIAAIPFIPFSLFNKTFNRAFSWTGRIYVRIVGMGLRVPLIVIVGYAAVLAAGVFGYKQLPVGFIPQQDKGYLIASIQLPDSASAERTLDTLQAITDTALEYEVEIPAGPGEEGAEQVERKGEMVWVKKVRPIAHVNAVGGNSFVLSAYGSNFGSMFIILKDFHERRHPDLYSTRVIQGLQKKLAVRVPGAQVNVFGASAVRGLGRAGGFKIMIEDRGDVGPKELERITNEFVTKANQMAQVTGLFTVYKTNTPQLFLDTDRPASMTRGVQPTDVSGALQGSMGSQYVNDFNLFGRTWQVNVQSDPKTRNRIEDVRTIKVRNKQGGMVPLPAVMRIRERGGPQIISRYNTYIAASVMGKVAPGISNGEGRVVLDELAHSILPHSTMNAEWTELTYIEEKSGKSELRIPGRKEPIREDTTVMVFSLSVAFVFLILAALYESWAFPLAVILVVPVCVASSLVAVWLTDPGSAVQTLKVAKLSPDHLWGAAAKLYEAAAWIDRVIIDSIKTNVGSAGIFKEDINIFTQVGFVVLIGLACKNAILIVEFAKIARDKGADLRTSVLEACALRFRPIIMTSVAFILGVAPLAVASGAGAEMRQALGIAVLGGMVGVTLFGIILTPIFFAIVDRLTNSRLARNRYVQAVSNALLYVLRLQFAKPLAGAVAAAAQSSLGKVTGRKNGA